MVPSLNLSFLFQRNIKLYIGKDTILNSNYFLYIETVKQSQRKARNRGNCKIQWVSYSNGTFYQIHQTDKNKSQPLKGTNCAPLSTDLFLFFYERDLVILLSDDNQAVVTEAFISTSRCIDDLLVLTILVYKVCLIKFIHLSCIWIKLMLQLPKSPFWTYIYLTILI